MDLLLEPEKIGYLIDRIDDLLIEMMLGYAKAGADAVFFCEDWGTQTSLFIRPDLWREIFKPRFVRLCGAAHELGLRIFMHSCGRMTVIIPDLIEAGIDVLQFDQPRIHGLGTLSQFSDQVTFWCPVDIQTTLPTRDPALIEAEAKEMIEKLGGNGGGFIAGYYGGYEGIGLEPKWQDIACRAFMAHGRYQTATAITP